MNVSVIEMTLEDVRILLDELPKDSPRYTQLLNTLIVGQTSVTITKAQFGIVGKDWYKKEEPK